MNGVYFYPWMRNSFLIDINIHSGFLELQRGERYLKFNSTVELFFFYSYYFLFLLFSIPLLALLQFPHL